MNRRVSLPLCCLLVRKHILWLTISWLVSSSPSAVIAQSPAELLNIQDYRLGSEPTEQVGGALVLDIIQDKRGFMWFATTKGLMNFDGIHYQHYYHLTGKPHSLGGNNVKEIRETPSGALYLALNDAGLSYFNPQAPESEAFTNYSHDPDDPRSIPTNVLYALEIDQKGIVWMGGKNSGLIRFDPRRQQFTTIKWPAAFNEDLETSVYDILADPDGTLWIGTSSSGLLHYHPDSQQFDVHSVRSIIPATYTGRNGTGSLYLDKDTQTLWFGSIAMGPCKLDKRTSQITPIVKPKPGQSQQLFECLMETLGTETGVFWIADRSHGLYRYVPKTQALSHIPFTKNPDESLWIDCAYLDKTGILWVATSRGVVRYRQAESQFVRQYPIQNMAGQPIAGVKRVEQDQRGDYWLELADRLVRYDTTQRAIVETIRFSPDLLRTGLRRIQVLGQQVFLHANNGLYLLDPQTRQIKPLPLKNMRQGFGSIEDRNWRLLPDTIAGRPMLWIGTFAYGLLRYWPDTQQLERVPLGRGETMAQNAEAIRRDRRKTIWVATNGQGLFRLDNAQTGQATQFLARPNTTTALPDNEVMDLLEDHRGTLWAATLTHGLVRINQRAGQVSFTTFATFPDGPPSRIFSFFNDAQYLFWVTTGDGLYVFNPATGRFLKHHATDQVVFPHDHDALSHSPDGHPLGIANGTILVGSDASSLFSTPTHAPLHFTGFQIFNQSHPEVLAATAGPVQLDHRQNGFSIQFAAPWFQHPERIRYRYQLVGFDPGWVEADTRREAFYTNMPHGQYTFNVQANWDGGDTFSRTISLPITVRPAYWETGWFRFVMALLLGLIGWAGWIYRQRAIQLKTNLLLAQAEKRQQATELREQEALFYHRMAETEMTALRSQMNPHFIFNCLNSIKLYATENDSAKASDYLSKFSKLIRMVLENSRSERVTLQNELDTLRLYLDMEAMRFKQKLTYRISVEPGIDAQFLELPPLLIQPYVENAIWHGLMHQPRGGTVVISVAQPHDDRLTITITDDGVGRARAAALKSKSANDRRSFGMKLTSDRIALINQLYQTHTAVTIHDLVSPTGDPQGTEVVLVIPV